MSTFTCRSTFLYASTTTPPPPPKKNEITVQIRHYLSFSLILSNCDAFLHNIHCLYLVSTLFTSKTIPLIITDLCLPVLEEESSFAIFRESMFSSPRFSKRGSSRDWLGKFLMAFGTVRKAFFSEKNTRFIMRNSNDDWRKKHLWQVLKFIFNTKLNTTFFTVRNV